MKKKYLELIIAEPTEAIKKFILSQPSKEDEDKDAKLTKLHQEIQDWVDDMNGLIDELGTDEKDVEDEEDFDSLFEDSVWEYKYG